MTNQLGQLDSYGAESFLAIEPRKQNQKKSLEAAYIDFIQSVIGKPDYSFTQTLKPVSGSRRRSTKVNDAEQAMDWFLHLLNSKCFGHGYRRKDLEIGVFAALEGLEINQQPHWHGAFRLPNNFSKEKFLFAYEYARFRTKRFGRQRRIEPYYEGIWHEYTTKTGVNSLAPQFLRRGTN